MATPGKDGPRKGLNEVEIFSALSANKLTPYRGGIRRTVDRVLGRAPSISVAEKLTLSRATTHLLGVEPQMGEAIRRMDVYDSQPATYKFVKTNQLQPPSVYEYEDRIMRLLGQGINESRDGHEKAARALFGAARRTMRLALLEHGKVGDLSEKGFTWHSGRRGTNGMSPIEVRIGLEDLHVLRRYPDVFKYLLNQKKASTR